MAGLRPRFTFSAGGLAADTDAPRAGPSRFVVERSLDVPIDSLRVVLAESGGVAAGDAVQLDLGDEDGLERVFTGTVAELRPRLGGCRLFCTGTMLGLVDLRVPGGPDGEALRSLLTRFPDLPLLVVTAHAEARPPDVSTPIFVKPFDSAALLLAVEQLHASHRAGHPHRNARHV